MRVPELAGFHFDAIPGNSQWRHCQQGDILLVFSSTEKDKTAQEMILEYAWMIRQDFINITRW
jgi:hypothetical protein